MPASSRFKKTDSKTKQVFILAEMSPYRDKNWACYQTANPSLRCRCLGVKLKRGRQTQVCPHTHGQNCSGKFHGDKVVVLVLSHCNSLTVSELNTKHSFTNLVSLQWNQKDHIVELQLRPHHQETRVRILVSELASGNIYNKPLQSAGRVCSESPLGHFSEKNCIQCFFLHLFSQLMIMRCRRKPWTWKNKVFGQCS